MIVTTRIEESQKPELLRLIHSAFEELADKGLDFTCSRYTVEDLEKKILSGKCFFAMENGRIVGVSSVTVNYGNRTAYGNITAIHPDYKSKGIGTMLYNVRKQYLVDEGVVAMYSDTAVNARSSVKWHLEKCGCSIIGYASFYNTNYYSYVFKEDFQPVGWFRKKVLYRLQFVSSFLLCRLFRKKDGTHSLLGHCLPKPLKKIL